MTSKWERLWLKVVKLGQMFICKGNSLKFAKGCLPLKNLSNLNYFSGGRGEGGRVWANY